MSIKKPKPSNSRKEYTKNPHPHHFLWSSNPHPLPHCNRIVFLHNFSHNFYFRKLFLILSFVHSLGVYLECFPWVSKFDPGHSFLVIFEGVRVRIRKNFVCRNCSQQHKEQVWFFEGFLIPCFWCPLRPVD